MAGAAIPGLDTAVRAPFVVLGILVVVLGVILPFASGPTEVGPQGLKTTIDPHAVARVVEREAAQAGASPEVARAASDDVARTVTDRQRKRTRAALRIQEVVTASEHAIEHAGADETTARRAGDNVGRSASEYVLGRNDPCWCGSGRKFKKCHGA